MLKKLAATTALGCAIIGLAACAGPASTQAPINPDGIAIATELSHNYTKTTEMVNVNDAEVLGIIRKPESNQVKIAYRSFTCGAGEAAWAVTNYADKGSNSTAAAPEFFTVKVIEGSEYAFDCGTPTIEEIVIDKPEAQDFLIEGLGDGTLLNGGLIDVAQSGFDYRDIPAGAYIDEYRSAVEIGSWMEGEAQ